jgi:hypothetical protein
MTRKLYNVEEPDGTYTVCDEDGRVVTRLDGEFKIISGLTGDRNDGIY